MRPRKMRLPEPNSEGRMAMKVNFFERLLLAVTGILGVFFAMALGAVAYFGDRLGLTLGDLRLTLRPGLWPAVVVGVIALAALVWGLKLMALAFKREPRQDRASVSVQHTENGSVRISVAAMDTLVKQAIAHDEGVVDVKTAIINHEDSISVSIDMTLASDVHIPNVTMMMQRTIKNFIEEFSGIAVREVTIMVSKIIEVTPQPQLKLEAAQPAKALEEAPKLALEPEAAFEPEPESEPEPEPESEPESEPEPARAEEPEPEPEPEPPEDEATEKDADAPAEGDGEQDIVNEKDVW
jgi:uncharacterized alkaline shock family protein YloU